MIRNGQKVEKTGGVLCPLCSSTEQEVLFRDYNRRDKIEFFGTYVQCSECSLVYIRERPSWQRMCEYYSMTDSDITASPGNVDISALRKQYEVAIPRWKEMLRKIRFRPHSFPLDTVPKESKRLLDVGCGTGAKLYEFVNRGFEVWGIDVSSSAVRLCQEFIPEGQFIHGELQDADLPDAYFDYIRIDNVLEHVPNPKEVIRECCRLLRYDGKLFVYVPNGRSFSLRFMKGHSISSWIPFHLQLFTHKSLRLLLNESGFEKIQIYGYYPFSWLPLSIAQWIRDKENKPGLSYPVWLNYILYPFGWVLSKTRFAEELVGVGTRLNPFERNDVHR